MTDLVGLAGARGDLLAFADFDADSTVDLYVRAGGRGDGAELQVWTWAQRDSTAESGAFSCDKKSERWSIPRLSGVVPGDFDGDGALDALVLTEVRAAAPFPTLPHPRL